MRLGGEPFEAFLADRPLHKRCQKMALYFSGLIVEHEQNINSSLQDPEMISLLRSVQSLMYLANRLDPAISEKPVPQGKCDGRTDDRLRGKATAAIAC